MTLAIKQHKENGKYITMFWEKGYINGIYVVEEYEEYNGQYTYPFKKMTYSINDKKKAEATFRRYVKKYCKGE